MNLKDFIESGVIEMYCMGLTSEEETQMVDMMASKHEEVRAEIAAVNQALHLYSVAAEKSPAAALREKILNALSHGDVKPKYSFPPRLYATSSVDEWKYYLSINNIKDPEDFEVAHFLELPSDEKQTSYVVWAKKGAVVEESHDDEDEYLFMLKGFCSVTIDGKIGYYKEGDLVYIPKNAVHKAEALSEGVMVLIGQRIAA
jgi:quercetin dioxygenase-like cupin family protein